MRLFAVITLTVVCIAGCQSNDNGTTVEPEPQAERQDLRGTFDYMIDAAALADMTVADYHFLPHRSALTPLGEQRLIRLAHIIDSYGGDIRFNTTLADETLIDARIETVIAFLGTQGIDTNAEIISEAGPGGVGMEAKEAILIKQNEGTYVPEGQSSGSSSNPLAP